MTLGDRRRKGEREITVAEAVSIPAGEVADVKVTGLPPDRHLWKFEGRTEDCMHAVSGTYLQLEVPVRNPGGQTKTLFSGQVLGVGRRLPTLPPALQNVEEESAALKDLYSELKLDENEMLKKYPGLLAETKKVIASTGTFSVVRTNVLESPTWSNATYS